MIVLKNGILIDGIAAEPIPDAVVIISGEEIVEVGVGSEVQIPDEPADIINLQSSYILPGLIDCHVHITIGGGPSGTFEHNQDYTLITTLKHAQATLESGITTIRDLGGRNYIEFVVRRAIEDGLYPGPRMVLAGKILSMTTAGDEFWPGMYREADGPDEVRKAAREQLKADVDFIKVMATGAAMTPGEQPVPQYTVEEIRAAVEEAHKVGKPVAVHASGVEGIRNSIEAGVDHIEHGSYLHEDPDTMKLMVDKCVTLIPTCKAFADPAHKGLEAGCPAWMIDQIKDEWENNKLSVKAAVEMGIPIVMGTDAGGPINYHGENATELIHLCEAGMSPMAAIKAATSRAAECVGLAHKVGAIEGGKLGDLLIVKNNPLEDIEVLSRKEEIMMIVKNGEIVQRNDSMR
ncbi:MAG: amidohydrolase family protein [Anaerolineales bacterium]|nr:amidohydrolase family protein [Anaerolineales bacterium]